jgi:SAM-dependent methyltransferase
VKISNLAGCAEENEPMADSLHDLSPELQSRKIPQCWSLESPVKGNDANDQGIWDAYWEGLNDEQQLFREQSDEYFRNLDATFGRDPRARVLDFGCGFGFVAEILAPQVRELFLWDASANMRRHARLNVAGRQNIRFLDLTDPQSLPDKLEFELILVNSVVQYMNLEEFSNWLSRWRNMLAPGGRIVVSDLIPPNYHALWDIADLLRFSARRGFFVNAVCQAMRDIWRYWGVRRVRPLARIGREDLSQRGKDAGLIVSYLPVNLTHFKKRLTAVFTLQKTD